jgi:hypothetical protein
MSSPGENQLEILAAEATSAEKLEQLKCLFEDKFNQFGMSLESANMMVGPMKTAIESLAVKILTAKDSGNLNLVDFIPEMAKIWQMQLDMSGDLMAEFEGNAIAHISEDGRIMANYSAYGHLFNLSSGMVSTFINWLIEHFGDTKGFDRLITSRELES